MLAYLFIKFIDTPSGRYRFLHHCNQTIGDMYFRTPRNTIKAFLDMLTVIEQDPTISWEKLITSVEVEKEQPADLVLQNKENRDEELADFKL